MKICLIPARGGSKRIPRKNIREFRGKPMIAWSISAAQESSCFDQIIVSTDDDEIAEVARAFGAEVPFLRPSHLADDQATTQDVIGHALEWFQRQGQVCEALCCLYATAPFVQPKDLQSADRNLNEARRAQWFLRRQAFLPDSACDSYRLGRLFIHVSARSICHSQPGS